jgi:predicted transcriptional regulator
MHYMTTTTYPTSVRLDDQTRRELDELIQHLEKQPLAKRAVKLNAISATPSNVIRYAIHNLATREGLRKAQS